MCRQGSRPAWALPVSWALQVMRQKAIKETRRGCSEVFGKRLPSVGRPAGRGVAIGRDVEANESIPVSLPPVPVPSSPFRNFLALPGSHCSCLPGPPTSGHSAHRHSASSPQPRRPRALPAGPALRGAVRDGPTSPTALGAAPSFSTFSSQPCFSTSHPGVSSSVEWVCRSLHCHCRGVTINGRMYGKRPHSAWHLEDQEWQPLCPRTWVSPRTPYACLARLCLLEPCPLRSSSDSTGPCSSPSQEHVWHV